MGFIQTAFAARQVLGLPIGIYLSTLWNWHVPFLALVVISVFGGLLGAPSRCSPSLERPGGAPQGAQRHWGLSL